MISLAQSKTAVAPNITASFLANGGTGPYTYSIVSGGAGGTIDSSSGLYTAPAVVNGGSYGPPTKIYDTVMATDSLNATARAKILVGNPLLLFCEIIRTQMNLTEDRVYLWDQKIMEPSDSGLFIAVAVLSAKPFSNINTFNGVDGEANQSVNMYVQLQLDVISRSSEARDRKEEVLLALMSDYSQAQQEGNSFYIGKLPPGSQFVNLSDPDGAAIPYRFNIAVAMQYCFTKEVVVPYFDTFSTTTETIEP